MSITLYQHFNYGGRKLELGTEAMFLGQYNDMLSSCDVKDTTWILYSDANFSGVYSILKPGKYPNSSAMRIPNDRLSSLRPLPAPTEHSILIFQHCDFKGRMVHMTGTTTDLVVIGFNDAASSAIVLSGKWRLYSDIECRGNSYDLGVGEHARLPGNDTLSSVQVLE